MKAFFRHASGKRIRLRKIWLQKVHANMAVRSYRFFEKALPQNLFNAQKFLWRFSVMQKIMASLERNLLLPFSPQEFSSAKQHRCINAQAIHWTRHDFKNLRALFPWPGNRVIFLRPFPISCRRENLTSHHPFLLCHVCGPFLMEADAIISASA